MSWIGNSGEMEGNVMANESAYERRRREASEVISRYEYDEYADQMAEFDEPMAEKSTPSKYKEFGVTTMLNLVQSALGSLEDNIGRLNSKIEPILQNVDENAMASSDPMPPLESGMAQELHAVLRRVQQLDNYVAMMSHRVDF